MDFEFIYQDMMKRLRSKRRISKENKYKMISACFEYATKYQKYEDLGELNVLKDN